MANTPDIRVRIRADGVASARASFKALEASASRSFGHIERSAAQAAASLRAISRPVFITIRGIASIARTTALVGTLAGALAGLEVSKYLDAGQSVTSMQAGLKVAIDRTSELEGQLADAEKRMTTLGRAGSSGFAGARDEVFRLRDELYKSRDVTAQVDAQFNKVKATADELGVELSKVGPAFVALANSTKGTNAAGATTERTFRGILMAGSALGRTNEEVEGSLLALQQIAGKGKVSMEELRGQLGERLPGAMNIAARAMGTNPAGLETMVAKGLDASIFLDRFSRQLVKEFAPAAEEAAKRPQASFARLRNRIFLARAEAANGGLARGLATIADSASVLIDRLEATGAFERTGARIGATIERLPALFAAVSHEVGVLRYYTTEWLRQMGVALGLDMSGWASNAAGAFGWVRQMLLQLAFDIPGVIYALRQAFAGNDGNVTERYAWVLTLRDFIQGQLMPLLEQVPAMVDRWVPIFVGVGTAFLAILETIRDTMVSIFGEEGANKIAAFLIIGKLTGMLSLVAASLSLVGTAVRGVVAAFNVLRAAALLMFTPPGGLIIAGIAAVAALAYVVYKNWDSIKGFLVGVWEAIGDAVDAFVGGIKSAWQGLADFLASPFETAKKVISAILEGLKNAVENSPAGLLFKSGKFLIEQGAKAAGFAQGGYVRGPGTGTSDSIPARLSNGEGVINARAMRAYGGKPFIDGLNRMSMGFGTPDVLEVGGGSPGRPLSLSIPGLGSASGKADDDLADGLQRLFERKTAGRARQRKPRGHR
ncbi:MAG: tape measure protein [Erythrobacter sp.]|nr:tape measure protein [Erythrobacter sp.]